MSNHTQDKAYFISFCIEQYAHRQKMTGPEVATLFDQQGLLRYLSANFDVLHSQSAQWIMEDIDEYINIRKESV